MDIDLHRVSYPPCHAAILSDRDNMGRQPHMTASFLPPLWQLVERMP
jgi:hypothetical protein